MGGKKNECSELLDILKIFQGGQLNQSIDNLTQSIKSLNQEISDLNTAAIKQNNQLTESLRHAKESSEELRKELEKLNDVGGRSHSLFERLEKAGEAADNLNRIVAIFTVMAGAIGLYSVYKDIACGTSSSCSYQLILISFISSIVSASILMVLLVWILKNKKNLCEKFLKKRGS